ncbi:TolC family protein [Devosia psychrophila]|uniref:Copper resistance protein n=1 Tax=Devosia psychrophila TaxID=728005 RepID=A0A0F5Q340_9HYPH|nr:TolC family protein [Devosia psychrophila]KKC34499.1 copper resistance protein [Devosia psychrophila]SFD39140.1 Outer membrane protein TolC [Devosia psychrophila]
MIDSCTARFPLPGRWLLSIAALALTLSACTTFSKDGGMSPVVSRVRAEINQDTVKISTPADEASARDRVQRLLASSLTADTAVQVALLNNRGLQAEFNELGVSEADYVAASLPENPVLSIGKLVNGADFEIERRLVGSLLSLFTLPARKSVAESEFAAAELRTVESTFTLAAETRRAFYRAVAAKQVVGQLESAKQAADAAAELTTKLGETGAATTLEQARASAFYAEVSNQVAEARLEEQLEREALTRVLGLWGPEIGFKLPSQLPPVPDSLMGQDALETVAMGKRVDLAAMRLELEVTAKSLGLTEATRFVSILDLAGLSTTKGSTETGESETEVGAELEVQIPLFDAGGASVRRASETYMMAVNRLTERAINARSEVRAAYIRYRATYDISWQYRNRILPLRTTIDEQATLEYSGMLTDVFDLLTTASESVDSNVAAIGAKRDFFLASVDLQAAMIGGGSSAEAGGASASAEEP